VARGPLKPGFGVGAGDPGFDLAASPTQWMARSFAFVCEERALGEVEGVEHPQWERWM